MNSDIKEVRAEELKLRAEEFSCGDKLLLTGTVYT